MTKEIILYTGISNLGNMKVVEISPLNNETVKVKVAGKDKLTYYFKKGDKFIYASLAGDTAEKSRAPGHPGTAGRNAG